MIQQTLQQFLTQHAIQNGRLLAAVSGGADSVALLRGLLEAAGEQRLELVAAHFDHALRPDSAADAGWVAGLCENLGVPCAIERATFSSETPAASEEASRQRRYDFLLRTAQTSGCQWVAVAHTADDQAETVLHHILRGSGLAGVSGMEEVRPLREGILLIRPLLRARRTDVLKALENWGQDFRIDPSNADPAYTRNRIRHVVLPLLREQINARVDDALLRLAEQAADAQGALERMAEELLQRALLDRQPDIVRLHRQALSERPLPLVRELFRRLWELQDWPRQGLGFEHLDRLARLSLESAPSRLSLPGGIQAVRRGPLLELRRP